MQPRIYTYKITFEEIPHWYWGAHKETKFGEFYLGTPVTHRWMWEFYTPKIQVLEFFPYTEEGWKKAGQIESRIIDPDLNNPLCLNENKGGVLSISACSKGGKASAETRTLEQKIEYGRMAAKVIHAEKDESGRSVNAVKAAEVSHAEKDEKGKSKHAVNMGKKGRHKEGKKRAEEMHAKKGENGKSINAMKGAAITNSQLWRSTEDGFVSTAGPVSRHNKSRGWDPSNRVRVE